MHNPLHYEHIPFDFDEWDNIPPILTKKCVNLSKYIGSTIDFMGKLDKRTHELEKLPEHIEEMKFQIDSTFREQH